MRLKHFPTGLLRCGISKRKAKLFVTALMVAATAQTCFAQNAGTETSGREGEQPIAAWTGKICVCLLSVTVKTLGHEMVVAFYRIQF